MYRIVRGDKSRGEYLEKIYLQGKPAGQRRADEAASAQYLR